MTAAEFHDRTWLPANRAESHRDHGMNRPGRSGIEAGAMNQITPTPANHDRPRPRLPEAGAGREVTGRRRSLLTAAIGRVSAGGRSLWPVGVRCAAAIVFLIFGVSKLVNHAAELASFRHYPVPAPGTFVYAVGVIEISGGLLLAVGLLTRLTALALAADMLGAIVVSGLALGAREPDPGADAASRDDHPVSGSGRRLVARPASGREHEPPLRGLPADLSGCPSLETGDSRASSSTSDR